jgi:hypothetical protein
MRKLNLKPAALGFVVGTRAALAFGFGLLASSRLSDDRRKRLALGLIGLGAATTIPAVRLLRRGRARRSEFPGTAHTPAMGYARGAR